MRAGSRRVTDKTYTKLSRSKIPDRALVWAGKIVLVLKGDQLGVKYIIILNEDGTPHEWPKSLEGEVDEIVRRFG